MRLTFETFIPISNPKCQQIEYHEELDHPSTKLMEILHQADTCILFFKLGALTNSPKLS